MFRQRQYTYIMISKKNEKLRRKLQRAPVRQKKHLVKKKKKKPTYPYTSFIA